MKVKLLSTLVLGAAIVASGCVATGPAAYTAPVNYTTVQMHLDGKVMAALMAIDKDEIAAAALVQKKSANPAVRSFAEYLYAQHSQDLAQVQALSQRINVAPVTGDVARMLQRGGRHLMAKLSHLKGAAFDRAYINAMVKGHSAALHVLDTKLIPVAVNPVVKAQLVNARGHVSMHLQKAMAIQSQIGR